MPKPELGSLGIINELCFSYAVVGGFFSLFALKYVQNHQLCWLFFHSHFEKFKLERFFVLCDSYFLCTYSFFVFSFFRCAKVESELGYMQSAKYKKYKTATDEPIETTWWDKLLHLLGQREKRIKIFQFFHSSHQLPRLWAVKSKRNWSALRAQRERKKWNHLNFDDLYLHRWSVSRVGNTIGRFVGSNHHTVEKRRKTKEQKNH